MSNPPPGQLPDQINPDVVMMVCTAGHVDHGKTRLVTLLTGCQTDTLKEEQERGLTIELGFAPCFLGHNLCVGLVDVPGHEKFVKNMVAGVSGIGMTILVIAADDGVMPQTVEHVQIMELLGVRRGLVALTKIDLVSPERRQQCLGEIREFLKDTFLAQAPICPVSSKTGEGYGEFYDTLVQQVGQIVQRRRAGLFRMPIESVFVHSGIGTIVTGIPIDGAVEVGMLVETAPGRQAGKIRSIQRFLREAAEGGQGQCLALNIPDFNKRPPVRGEVVCLPGCLTPASCFHVRLQTIAGLGKPLHNAEEIKFHAGTSEEPGKLYLLDAAELGPGASGLATVALSNPVAAAAHDRFILRRLSPAATIAGGEILAASLAEHRPRKMVLLPWLREYQTRFGGLDPATPEGREKLLEGCLWRDYPQGAHLSVLAKTALLPDRVARETAARMAASNRLLWLTEDHLIHAETYPKRLAEVESRLQRLCQEKKLFSLPLSDVRPNADWPPALWNKIEADLTRRNLVKRSGDKYLFPGAVDRMPAADRALMDRVLRTYQDTGFHSPRPDELPELLHAPLSDVTRLLQHLYNEGRLVRLADNVILSIGHMKTAQELVVKTIQQKGILNSADFKYQIDSTRKYALAILDYLDARRITVRIQNDRKLTSEYQKQLL